MKKLIVVLILSGILFGCNKPSDEEEYYTLAGLVLEFDANTPMPGAKVYVKEYGLGGRIVDSAISDANGRVSFNLRKEGEFKFIYPAKANYLNPINWTGYHANYNDRTENLYLAKPSFVNVTTHKTGSYLSSDTVDIQVLFVYLPNFGQIGSWLLF